MLALFNSVEGQDRVHVIEVLQSPWQCGECWKLPFLGCMQRVLQGVSLNAQQIRLVPGATVQSMLKINPSRLYNVHICLKENSSQENSAMSWKDDPKPKTTESRRCWQQFSARIAMNSWLGREIHFYKHCASMWIFTVFTGRSWRRAHLEWSPRSRIPPQKAQSGSWRSSRANQQGQEWERQGLKKLVAWGGRFQLIHVRPRLTSF